MISIEGTGQELYRDLVEIYKKNKRKFSEIIKNESELLDFCASSCSAQRAIWTVELAYEHICKLAYIFSNILGKQMPDHIHARLLLGPNNVWIKKYVEYTKQLKPHLFGIINTNKNNFKLCRLSNNGYIQKYTLK